MGNNRTTTIFPKYTSDSELLYISLSSSNTPCPFLLTKTPFTSPSRFTVGIFRKHQIPKRIARHWIYQFLYPLQSFFISCLTTLFFNLPKSSKFSKISPRFLQNFALTAILPFGKLRACLRSILYPWKAISYHFIRDVRTQRGLKSG